MSLCYSVSAGAIEYDHCRHNMMTINVINVYLVEIGDIWINEMYDTQMSCAMTTEISITFCHADCLNFNSKSDCV